MVQSAATPSITQIGNRMLPVLTPKNVVLHHRKPLRQRENADDLLHRLWHNLNRQRCAGKDQHGEIENRGNDACLLGVLCHAACQHTDGQGREHGKRPAPEES